MRPSEAADRVQPPTTPLTTPLSADAQREAEASKSSQAMSGECDMQVTWSEMQRPVDRDGLRLILAGRPLGTFSAFARPPPPNVLLVDPASLLLLPSCRLTTTTTLLRMGLLLASGTLD